MQILIVGTSSGIGRHLAEQLWQRGHGIWGWARRDQSAWTKEIDPTQQRLRVTQVDASQWLEVDAAAHEIAATWDHLDAILCCAGVHGPIGPAMHADPLTWEETVRGNLMASYFPLRALFDLLLKHRTASRAKIILLSGGGASKARARFSAYAASKTAVVRLAETLAAEWQNQPADINAMAPGAIHTRLTEEIIRSGPEAAGQEEYAAALKLDKNPDSAMRKVTAMTEFLLSSQSDHLSGKFISAAWDDCHTLAEGREQLQNSAELTLRRLVP